MENILLIINPDKPGLASIDFACNVATSAQARLTGVFIENFYFEYIPIGDAMAPAYFGQLQENSQVKADTDQAVRIFQEECQRKGIIPEVYVDKGEPIQEVIYESRFADLVIIDPYMNFYEREEDAPSHFAREILAHAECPVLIAPEKFESIEEIIFCYDGSASSLFAIKLFTYLFPAFSKKNVMLLEISKSDSEQVDESHKRIMQWLGSHYNDVHYHALKGDVKDELFTWFFMKEKKLIVMGAYGRPLLSRFFNKSAADVLIRMVDLPIFITHH